MSNASDRPAKGQRLPLLIAAACLIGTAWWVLATGDNLPGKPNSADKPVPAENVMSFAELYATHCAACHGADGHSGPAPALNDPLFRAIVPANVLEKVISEGRPGTPMPGFARAHGGVLSAEQVQVLVDQIHGVSYKIIGQSANGREPAKVVEASGGTSMAWGSVKPAPPGTPPYESAGPRRSRTAANVETIRTTLFARACADCHGDNGQGSDSAGAIDTREFLALTSDQSLRRIILTGRPDLGMPDYQGADQRAADFKPLNSAEIDDLVALLATWRRGMSAPVK